MKKEAIWLETNNEVLLGIWKMEGAGGFLIALVAIGPPTVVNLICLLVSWPLGHLDLFIPTFGELTPLYFSVFGGGTTLWNLVLQFVWKTKIGLFYMPAWVFGLFCIFIGNYSEFLG